MAEKQFEIITVGIDYECDKCSKGIMIVDGSSFMLCSDPPQWTHQCTCCGNRQNFTKKYPTTEFRRKPIEE